MDTNNKVSIDPEKLHRRQSMAWIYLPLGLICLLVLGVGVFITLKSGTDVSLTQTWSSIGMIFIIIPPALLSILVITILILAIFGMGKANQALPPHLRSFRQKIIGVNQKAQNITNKAASPIIKTRAIFSAIKAFFRVSKWKSS
jgi:hypothetical protein